VYYKVKKGMDGFDPEPIIPYLVGSGAEIGARLGINPSTVNLIRAGKRRLSPPLARYLCLDLGLDGEELWGDHWRVVFGDLAPYHFEGTKELICSCGLTNVQIARRLGVSQTTVSRWRNGHCRMPVHMKDRLEEAVESAA